MKPDKTHPVTSVDAHIDYNVTKVPSPKDSDHINGIISSNSIDGDHKKSQDESEDITGRTMTKNTSTESTLNGHLVQQLQDENDRYSHRLGDIEETHQRQMRELRDELDIAQQQSNSAYAMEKQMKQYQQRMEAMNDLNADLTKTQHLLSQQCQETEQLKERLKVIPNLKQQIEKYKSQMIQYKVAIIGVGGSATEKQVTRKMARLEEAVTKLRHENDELKLHLKTSRKEIISLQSQINQQSNDLLMAKNGGNEIGRTFRGNTEMQRKIARLESENKRLRTSLYSKQSMTMSPAVPATSPWHLLSL